MSQRLPNRLAWTLLGRTVVLLAAAVVLGLTGGVAWTEVFGFIPVTLSFALVVAPLGRDQPDNAARVVYAGAGLRVSRRASVADLRDAIGRVLDGPRFRTAARRLAATLAAERDEGLVVDELERTALERTAMSHSTKRDPSCQS